MPRNGSGTYSLPSGNPVVTGTSISSNAFNNTMTDLAAGLSGSLATDGQTPWAGNQNANGNRVANLGAASVNTDAANLGDVKGQTTQLATQLAMQAAINGFRLTLQSGVPVPTADVTAASTLYATPYKGSGIALYSGGAWGLYTSGEFSLALSSLTLNRPHDVFCYVNSGVAALEVLPWASTTARTTALAYQNGILVKSGDPTRRYLGTFASLSATTTEDSARRRFLWNYYHRVRRPWFVAEGAASWTYTTSAYRQVNGNSSNQLEYVCGLQEDSVSIQARTSFSNTSAGVTSLCAIGLDGVTPVGNLVPGQADAPSVSNRAAISCSHEGLMQLGYHFYPQLEYSGAAGTTTFTGAGPTGMTGSVLA